MRWHKGGGIEMTFDIHGLAPTDEVGEYFMNNNWWWRPLAGVIETSCSDLLTDEQKNGLQYNDGAKYSNEIAIKIAERLETEIKQPSVLKATAKKFTGEHHQFSIDNVKDFINFAKKSGGFQIY